MAGWKTTVSRVPWPIADSEEFALENVNYDEEEYALLDGTDMSAKSKDPGSFGHR